MPEHGVSFSLDNGGYPTIAAVGAPTAAFEGSYGPDTPAPEQAIGSFFLTDDGRLVGLTAPALLVHFERPVWGASGVILDIDFDESFEILARDADDEVIGSIAITAGDPGTGDGIATPWSFDFDAPVIHSLRLHGTRSAAGGFGLGFDNFNPRCPNDS